MVVDAVRTYLDAANGLTELSRKQAVAAAKTLIRANGTTAPAASPAEGEAPPRVGQSIQTLAGELIETSQANRAAVADLVRAEVRSALEQMDMVPRSEYERVVRRVAELERRMAARQTVERVLAPRGGASSVLPAREEGYGAAVQEKAVVAEEPTEWAGAAESAKSSESGVSSERGERPQDVEGDEAEQTARSAAEDTSATDPADSAGDVAAAATADTTDEDTEDAENSKGSGDSEDTADADESDDGSDDGSEPKAAAKRTTTAATPARSKAKTGAKSTRARSTAKRTTKSKGAKK